MARRVDNLGFGNLSIIQETDKFCYGVDAILLADFAASSIKTNHKSVLDLGTGNGIIPLVLSHKTKIEKIAGLEIQNEAYGLALENVELNGLEGRIQIFQGDVSRRDGFFGLESGSFDAITCNPPYFLKNGAISSSSMEVVIARQEIAASLEDFLYCGKMLLRDRGEFYLIHRPSRIADILECARAFKLEPREIRFVSDKALEKPKMVLVRMIKNGGRNLEVMKPLVVHKDDGHYTDEIMKIYERI